MTEGDSNHVRRTLLTVSLTLIVLFLGFVSYSARWILLAVLLGLGLGVLITPPMSFLSEKLKIPKPLSAFLFLLLIFAGTFGVLYLIFSIIAEQVPELTNKLQGLPSFLQDQINAFRSRVPWLKSATDGLDVRRLLNPQMIQGSLQPLAQGVQLGAAAIGGYFFVVAVALYFAVHPDGYVRGTLSLFPAHMRPRVRMILHASASSFRRWFIAQLIAMSVVGTVTGFGLWLIGVDSWLLFGLLTAVLDLVPYVGPIAAWAGATMVALVSDPSQAIWVTVLFLIVQQLEGDLVLPAVMKGQIDLPPIHLMTLMLILGSWFGILGVLIGPPLLAIGRRVYLMTYVPVMDRKAEPLKSQRPAA